MKKPSFLIQFLLALTGVILVSQTILLLIFTQQIKHDLEEASLTSLRGTAYLLKEWEREDLSAVFSGQEKNILNKISNRGGYRISLFDAKGVLIQDTHLSPGIFQDGTEQSEIDQARIEREGISIHYSPVMDRQMLYFALAFFDKGQISGFIRIGTPVDGLSQSISNLFLFFFSITFLSLAAVFTLAYYYSRDFTKNITSLIQNGNLFAKGLSYEKIFIEKPQELRLLAQSMNRMFDQLEDRITTIRRQKNELQAILSGMVEGVIVLDRNSIIKNMNPAALGLFPCEKPVGLSLIEVCRNSDLDSLVRPLISGKSNQNKSEIILNDLVTTIQVQAAALSYESGEIWGVVLVISDITQLKKLENMRRDFVSNVSHELKTPITNIIGFVETLQQGMVLSDPQKTQQFLDVIERHANRINAIIDDLLILSRIENNPPKEWDRENISLPELILDAVQMCHKKIDSKKITLEFDFPEEPILTAVYPLLMEQAIVNLLDNAIKFSHEKSAITLGLKRMGSDIQITIQDQGIGISPKDQERIFERFYRTEKGRTVEGTGLGLSIVKHIMLVHRGKIVVMSPVPPSGTGTLFTLTFPLVSGRHEND